MIYMYLRSFISGIFAHGEHDAHIAGITYPSLIGATAGAGEGRA
jgi:hypothetical protein